MNLLPVRPDLIPAALKQCRQFVVWKLEPDPKGKPTKVPYNPVTGGKASTTKPTTWGTSTEALEAYNRGGYSGMGFVLSEPDPYAGSDLDHCVDEQGKVDAWAMEIVREIDSYTEVSPSGTGLRIWTRAKLPPGGRKKGDIEMYDSVRFLTLTGHHLPGTPREIRDRQQEMSALHARVFPPKEKKQAATRPASVLSLDDHEVVAKATRNEKSGAAFDQLYRGDWRGLHPSPSEADLAFCNRLAFWCGGDRAQMDRIFRDSGLMRDKWDRKHFADSRTYGEKTIDEAIANTPAFYDPLYRSHDYTSDPEPVPGAGALSERFAGAVEEQPEPVEVPSKIYQPPTIEVPEESPIGDNPPASVAIVASADCAQLVALLQAELERVKEAAAAREAFLTRAIEINDTRIAELEAENTALREERRVIQAAIYNPQFDYKTRLVAGCLLLDPTAEARPDGARAIPAATYRQLSDRCHMKVSTLQNAIQPLKQAGIVQADASTRYDEEKGHPMTDAVTMTYQPEAFSRRAPLPTTSRTANNRAKAKARWEDMKEVAAIGRAAKAAECPYCKQTGCMELYCSTHGVPILHSIVEQVSNPLELTEALEAIADSPSKFCHPPEAPQLQADPPGKICQTTEEDCLVKFTTPQDGTDAAVTLPMLWEEPKPWDLEQEPITRVEDSAAVIDRINYDAHRSGYRPSTATAAD